MNIGALEQRYQILLSDFQAGRINPAIFAAEVDKLSFQDDEGRYWMMGTQSGAWYYYDGESWRPANPRQITLQPSVPVDAPPPQAGSQRRPQETLPARTLFLIPVRFMWLTGLAFLVILSLCTWPVSSAPPAGGPDVAPSPRPPVSQGESEGGGDDGDGDGGGGGTPHSAIFGNIVDLSTDRPGAGLEVSVNGGIVRSDTEGNYSITGLSAGEYQVSLDLQGEGVPAHGPIFVNLDGRNPVTVDLAYYTEAPPLPTDTPQPAPAIAAEAPAELPDSGAPRSSQLPLFLLVCGLLLALGGSLAYRNSSV
jgi:hypothetical protein